MIDESVRDDTNPRHNTPKNEILSKRMEYPWHPYFGQLFNIHSHFSRAHVQTYRCRPSDHPERMRLDMPAWMFDRACCSKMKLLKEPYSSLDSLKHLLLLLREASSSECIIGQDRNTFNQKGDADAKLRLTTKNSRSASVSSTQSPSDNMEEPIQTAGGSINETCEHDASGTSKASRRVL
jgi:hypothetical protein